MKKMDIDKFWHRTEDVFNLYHDRYRRAVLTDEEQQKDVASFISDMDSLAAEWIADRVRRMQ